MNVLQAISSMPAVPHMADISDLFGNLQNNIKHLGSVFGVLFGSIFAFFVAKKIIGLIKGDGDDD
jgi:hypothetical protein